MTQSGDRPGATPSRKGGKVRPPEAHNLVRRARPRSPQTPGERERGGGPGTQGPRDAQGCTQGSGGGARGRGARGRGAAALSAMRSRREWHKGTPLREAGSRGARVRLAQAAVMGQETDQPRWTEAD